ncbi:hypothetical protein M409DRAFT_71248 [Zasmidium cellare ATCC 36951]|uniref:Uncharacterized protein n=1 Tax=Zasmidium cellare ATCC 36951 TaxID=1080233 RepID=A0A6A6BZV7_ZASCE|nr:uncharacterized protein M409DRAFT_71248 [Zasmidium cellare ATCC 36951]KAF2159122.1 hypothetical protein M409DRAFT_71248 [Zasmidium cellare ATCC 36951]
MASLRLAFPRGGFPLHSKQLQRLRFTPSIRHASTTPPPKPRVLEKPDKFRPPSHPSRLRSKPKYNYGPDLSQEQKAKRYPHMMPPEGTFLHWFLTNRSIHVWISMSVLISLIFGIWLSDFLNNTPYRDLLPPNSMFWAHPFQFLARWGEVYNMHVAYVSQQTAEMRKQKVEDVKKRSEYRKAHGIEESEGILGGWTARMADEVTGQGETYIDFEGKQQPAKKKWFGIW